MRHDPDVAFQMRVEANRKKLRDQFAMAALQGLLTCPDNYNEIESVLARWAYEQADAMLEARDDT